MGVLEIENGAVHIPTCLENDEEELESDGFGGSGSESTRTIEEAVEVLLRGLGEDCEREGLSKTPFRVAKAFRDGTRGYKQKVNDIVQGALFPEAGLHNGVGRAGGAGGLVVVRDINLFSYCESCLLPFRVLCHVGYVSSGQRVVGLSKLARVADVFAKRLQAPQRLADEICSALHSSIKPSGVVVALQCWHIQLPESLKGISNWKTAHMQGWLQVHACSTSGVFKDESSNFLDEFSALLKVRGVKMENSVPRNPFVQFSHCNGYGNGKCTTNGKPVLSWCPMSSMGIPLCNGHGTMNNKSGTLSSENGTLYPAMIGAVTSILHSIGEDPIRKELVATPCQFVNWLLRFKKSTSELKLNFLNYGILASYANGEIEDNQQVIHSELNLPFCSQCEHHLLPFQGMVHIGYFLGKESQPLDRSLLHSVVQFYGCKLQVQERLTRQIAEKVFSTFSKGVMVVVEADHICMIARGVEKLGSSTATVATMGQFSTDASARSIFLQTIFENTGSGE